MKKLILIAALFFPGCSFMAEKPDLYSEDIPRTQRVIECTKGFLRQDLTAEASYKICKDVFSRKK